MRKARPYYETSYKLEIAKMVVDQGLTQIQVCKGLSISQIWTDGLNNTGLKHAVNQAMVVR